MKTWYTLGILTTLQFLNMPSWRAWLPLAMITFSRGPCPTVWMDSLGIIPFAQALHITTSTEASGRPNSLQRMSLLWKEKSKRHLYMLNICGYFIQSSQKSKHHTEFKNCSEPLFSHMRTKSQIRQMTYSWSHIFGKNRFKNSCFKSRVLCK